MRRYIIFVAVTVCVFNGLTAQIVPVAAQTGFTGEVLVVENQPYALDEGYGLQGGRDLYRPWSISLLYGRTIGGPAAKWKEVLKESDFNDYASNWLFGGITKYPKSRSKFDWQLRIDYLYRPKRAYGVMFHQSNRGEVVGYNQEPFNRRLEIQYGMSGMGVYHQWYLGAKNNFNVYAGPILNRTKLSFEGLSLPVTSSSVFEAWKLGFTTGLQLSLWEREKSYIRFNLAYRHLQVLQSDSYSMVVYEYDNGVPSKSTQLAVPAEKTSFSSFWLSLVFGFRMGNSR